MAPTTVRTASSVVGDGAIDLGEKGAGADGVGRDAMRREFQRERARHLDDGAFARGVGRAMRQTHEAERAGEIDDAARSPRAFHMGHDGAAAEPGAVDIGPHDLPIGLDGKFLDRATHVDARRC